jgi:D-alanyl-D-alanine dipeptidase
LFFLYPVRCTLSTIRFTLKTLLFVTFIFVGPLFAKDNPLIDLEKFIPGLRVDIRYATTDNFMKEKLYPEARCLLRVEVAQKLKRVQERLKEKGLSLKIFDGYRPLSVQKKMWAKVPIEGYVANPAKGSNHNRGATVDVTLTDARGKELAMPSPYDEFSERAHRDYPGGTDEERAHRTLLEEAMKKEGFVGIGTEWWHFDDAEAKKYPVLDLPFASVDST